MKIVSLQPFTTEVICALGLSDSLVAVSHRCDYPTSVVSKLPKVTSPGRSLGEQATVLERALSLDSIDFDLITQLQPDVIVTRDLSGVYTISDEEVESELVSTFGGPVKIIKFDPRFFSDIPTMFESAGEQLGAKSRGHELAAQLNAQCLDWVDNFYERTRGKKVTFLAGTDPILLGGLWIPEMISRTSAVSQHKRPGYKHIQISWEEVLQFAPDVIVIAPSGVTLNGAIKRLGYFEQLPNWDLIPAVKRGEVIFCDGAVNFSRPGPRIIDSFGILLSAIAGLESGYITKRDSFQRLRWVELHRSRA